MSSHPVQDAGPAPRDAGLASDAELIARVRGGDGGAYGELYDRHRRAAVGLARRFARNPSDAEDLAAEAFANVLTALKAGSGPQSFFRAYLFTALARLAARRNSRDSRQRPVEDVAAFESPEAYVDPVLTSFESRTIAQAYRSLPERWQAVLWYTEVDGMQPAAVAPLLGLSANGVSALALRAREGLRQAYLQQHLAHSSSEECAAYAGKLGAYARNGLSPRSRAKVQQHLEECGPCTAMLVQLRDVGAGMRGIIFPLVAGVAGIGAAGIGVAGTAGGLAGAGGAAATAGTAGGLAGWLKTAAASMWKWSALHPAGAGAAAAGAAATALVGGAVVGGVLLPPASSAAAGPPDPVQPGAAATVPADRRPAAGGTPARPHPTARASGTGRAATPASAASVRPAPPRSAGGPGRAAAPGPGSLRGLPGAAVLPGQLPTVAVSVPLPGVPLPGVPLPSGRATGPAAGSVTGGPDRGGPQLGLRISAPQGPARLRVEVDAPSSARSASIRFTARVDRMHLPLGTPGVPAVSEALAVQPPTGWSCAGAPAVTVCSTADAAGATGIFIVRVVPLPRVPQILSAAVSADGAAPASSAAYY